MSASRSVLHIESNALSGSLPVSVSSLVGLENLVAYSNRLTGSLTDSFVRLAGLQYVIARRERCVVMWLAVGGV